MAGIILSINQIDLYKSRYLAKIDFTLCYVVRFYTWDLNHIFFSKI